MDVSKAMEISDTVNVHALNLALTGMDWKSKSEFDQGSCEIEEAVEKRTGRVWCC